LQDLGEELNALSKAGRWDDMTRRISDDLVHEFAAVAPYDRLKSSIEAHFGGLVDCISLPADTPPQLVQDLKTIACLYQSSSA